MQKSKNVLKKRLVAASVLTCAIAFGSVAYAEVQTRNQILSIGEISVLVNEQFQGTISAIDLNVDEGQNTVYAVTVLSDTTRYDIVVNARTGVVMSGSFVNKTPEDMIITETVLQNDTVVTPPTEAVAPVIPPTETVAPPTETVPVTPPVEIAVEANTNNNVSMQQPSGNSNRTSRPTNTISSDRAKELALARVGSGFVDDVELGYRSQFNTWVWEVEIRTDRNIEHNIYIDAVTEEIINPTNIISSARAGEIALERAGSGIIDDMELDYQSRFGTWVWDVEVKVDRNIEYDVYIDAITGEILRFTRD